MALKIVKHELNERSVWQDSKTLKAICNHVNGFGEADYKHISDGIIKILKGEKLIE